MILFDNFFNNAFVREAVHDKIYNCHLELDHIALDIGKACASNLSSAFLINPAASLADFVVILRLEVKLGRLANNLGDFVVVFGEANRNIIFWDVRNEFELCEIFWLNFG